MGDVPALIGNDPTNNVKTLVARLQGPLDPVPYRKHVLFCYALLTTVLWETRVKATMVTLDRVIFLEVRSEYFSKR